MIHAVVLYLVIQAAAPSANQHEEAGLAALKAGNKDAAIEEFKKATELDPKDSQGFFDLGVAYIQSKDYGSAIAPLKKALELDPNLTAAHRPLGYALLAQPRQPCKQEKLDHRRSGSRTSRNWSEWTSLRTCFTPEGQ